MFYGHIVQEMGTHKMCADRSDGSSDETAAEHYRHLVEHLHDAVVEFTLVDGEPIVDSVNDAFVDIFGYDRTTLHGESLNKWIVPDWLADEATKLDVRTSTGEINYRRVKRETTSGLREFLYRGIPYEDDADRIKGFAVYTDLTEINRNKRRLEVMNRVLRHNLRNSANIISAHMTRLLEQCSTRDDGTVDTAATVEAAAHNLEQLAQEAEDIRSILTDAAPDDATVDCVPLLQQLAKDYRQSTPSARITTALPQTLELQADRRLRSAIESLVDNAIEHNPADTPKVRIRATATDAPGWALIAIEDNGPRIPESERTVITDEEAITPTQHGSGLGLWLVKWTVELLGGEISFDSSDLGGNSVRIRLPRA